MRNWLLENCIDKVLNITLPVTMGGAMTGCDCLCPSGMSTVAVVAVEDPSGRTSVRVTVILMLLDAIVFAFHRRWMMCANFRNKFY